MAFELRPEFANGPKWSKQCEIETPKLKLKLKLKPKLNPKPRLVSFA